MKNTFSRKRIRILGNTLWTTGSITEKRRGSLASLPPEGVSTSNGHWIKDGWIGLDRREGEKTGSPGKTTKTAATELAGAHG